MFKKISIYYNNDKAVAQPLLSFILSKNTACRIEEVTKSYAGKYEKRRGTIYGEIIVSDRRHGADCTGRHLKRRQRRQKRKVEKEIRLWQQMLKVCFM